MADECKLLIIDPVGKQQRAIDSLPAPFGPGFGPGQLWGGKELLSGGLVEGDSPVWAGWITNLAEATTTSRCEFERWMQVSAISSSTAGSTVASYSADSSAWSLAARRRGRDPNDLTEAMRLALDVGSLDPTHRMPDWAERVMMEARDNAAL